MARLVFGITAAVASLSLAVALTQPDSALAGVAVAATPAPTSAEPPAPDVTPPTTAAVYAASGKRESCGWSWDATHFDDGTLNEVTLSLDAPRRPNAAVTITAKPGASAPLVLATATDDDGQASMVVSLSNDKRDWTLTINAAFLGSSCDPRTFTISY